MSVARNDSERLVIFIGSKQASPESVRRWCDKLIAKTKQMKKPPGIKKIWQSYKVSKELTAIEALKLKRFHDEEMGGL